MSATLQRSQQQQPTKEREQDGAAPSAPSRAGLLPPLEAELQRTPASNLQPEAFFVSWQGVLTLAYR